MGTIHRQVVMIVLGLLMVAARATRQKVHTPEGDTPETAGPLAFDLSPALTPQAIAKAMRKVGDWELARSRPDFSQDWTYAALYRGFLAAAKSLPDDQYKDAILDVGKEFDWKLGPRTTEGDDQAIGYIYLSLYRQYHDPKMLEATRAQFDRLMQMPNACTETCPDGSDQNTPVWWWADSFLMAPPIWARLSSATRQKAYLNHLDQGWWITSKLLYDPVEHLYTRDARYLDQHEANGKKIFWSRGNGWVIAGLALVLQEVSKNSPSPPRYLHQFRKMASRRASIQGKDGLWRPGLLNPSAYPLSEISGSSFFVYALAWGINNGILDRATYLPVIQNAWAGLVSHIYADGGLGCIQPIGPAPGDFKPQSSYVYGVGAFLMAESQLRTLARNYKP